MEPQVITLFHKGLWLTLITCPVSIFTENQNVKAATEEQMIQEEAWEVTEYME